MSTARAAPSAAPLFGAAFVLAVDAAGTGHLLAALESATHAPPRGGSWFITMFVLGALVGAPLLARTAERSGRVHVLRSALVGFALATAVVGLSSSFALTLFARFSQGFAGSAIVPLAAAHLTQTTASTGGAGRSVSLLTLSYSAGFVAGIVFVSLFLLVSFRSAYFFTATLAGGAAAAMGSLRESPTSTRDGPSLVRLVAWLIALGLTAFALNHATLSHGELEAMPTLHRLAVRTAEVAAGPALVLFAWYDGRATPSLLPADSFRSRGGIASACLALVAGLGQASVVVLPTCAMAMLGVSAAASGPLLVPVLVGGVAANVLAAARLDRWGPIPFLTSGAALVTAGNLITAKLGEHFVAFEAGALVLGAGVSLLSSGALRHLAASYGSPDDANARQAAISLLTNVGLMGGSALWGATLATVSGAEGARAGLLTLAWAEVPLAAGLLLLKAPLVGGDEGARWPKPSDGA